MAVSVNPELPKNIMDKIDEIVKELGDSDLQDNEILTLALNFSFYFATNHLSVIHRTRDPTISANRDMFYNEFMTTYLNILTGQAEVIQTMIANDLKTTDDYMSFVKRNKNNND